ncbi:hypothetical protein [Wolbachia endosymbiont of Cantharis cryptica]|uniref:hypothetical protein n=1 Tax=Wolbachia endosymbiont of Cantharis cryptica TaxID=3066132 RepID=UPI00376EC460
MAASLSFKQQNGTDNATNINDAKVIVYTDSTGNKYTFGVDSGNVFNTFKYHANGVADAVDYSTIATKLDFFQNWQTREKKYKIRYFKV